MRSSMVVFLAALSSSGLGIAAELSSPQASKSHVWLFDGKHTYLAVRALLPARDVVLTVDPSDEITSNVVLAFAVQRYIQPGTADGITAVGQMTPTFIKRLLDLQNARVCTVGIEPRVQELVRSRVQATSGPITLLWVPYAARLPMAVHAASLRREAGEVAVPTSDPSQLEWLVGTGRVERALCMGSCTLPVPPGDAKNIHVEDVAGWQDLLRYGIGTGSGSSDFTPPPPGPLPRGARFTLAFYTGQVLLDNQPLPNQRPLSFYDSTVVATEFCNGRSTCIPVGLIPDLGINPPFDPNPPVSSPPKFAGWQADIEHVVRTQISQVVNTFNADPQNVANDFRITKLAIVAHPVDIPYAASSTAM